MHPSCLDRADPTAPSLRFGLSAGLRGTRCGADIAPHTRDAVDHFERALLCGTRSEDGAPLGNWNSDIERQRSEPDPRCGA